LFIFTRGHYSFLRVLGAQPRVLFKGPNPTEQEKLAAYDSFTANSGTYDVTGTTLTVRPIIAKIPNYMAGGYEKYQFRISADTLWLTTRPSDFNARIGDRIVPGSGPGGETRKLVRVE
jgi:hypothetical protein